MLSFAGLITTVLGLLAINPWAAVAAVGIENRDVEEIGSIPGGSISSGPPSPNSPTRRRDVEELGSIPGGTISSGPPARRFNERRDVEELGSIPGGWINSGRPSPSTPIRLRLAIRQERSAALERMVLDISTPGHPRYGQYMKRDDLKKVLQPPEHVSSSIVSWLKQEGVDGRSIVDDGDWVHFVVPVSKAESLLETRFYQFQDANDPSVSKIRTLRYSVPEDIAPYVHTIQPTTAFGSTRPQLNTIFESHLEVQVGDKKDCNQTMTPACLRDLYNIGDFLATPDPRNVIGVSGFLDQYARFNDFKKFLELYAPELEGTNFSVQSINGGENLQDSTKGSSEASLDIQYALGLSNATAVYYTTGGRGPLVPDLDQPGPSDNRNEPYLEQLHYFRDLPDDKLPAILTTSYGENEQSVPKKYSDAVCDLFTQLGARGVSIIFSSGDSGVGSSCQTNDGKKQTRFNPMFPGACPFVTSVGSTQYINPESAIDWSSGGFSERYSRPQYQDKAVNEYLGKLGNKWDGLYNPEGRGFPDIALQGSNFQIVDKGRVTGVSGTR